LQLLTAVVVVILGGHADYVALGWLIAYMQFLPVVDGEGKEKELITNVMKKVLAENDFSGLDVNKVTYRSNHPGSVL
jgi:hypothetical protein